MDADWPYPILDYQPGGGVPVGPVSNPPVYSQADVTPLIIGQAYVDVVFGSVQTDMTWVLVECDVVNTADLTPLNIWPGLITNRTTAGFRVWLNGMPDSGNYYLHWAVSGINILPVPATLYLFTGPASGVFGVNLPFTVKLPPSTTLAVPITVTPNDGGTGGTFAPPSVTLSSGSASATFVYNAVAYGAATISVTNSGTLSDPASIVFTSVAPIYTFTGPSGGVSGVPSTNFTVQIGADAVLAVPTTVTPNDGGAGGTFTPTTVLLAAGVPLHFTYTPASAGAKTISVTNNGGLTNPVNLTYTAAPTPFDPTTIAGLKLWLKADSLVLSDGTAVGAWNDSSSNAANFAQATAGNKPIYKTGILNGNPVVRFDGVDDYLTNTSALITGTYYTILAVVKPTTTAVAAIFCSGAAATQAPALLLGHTTTIWFLQQRINVGGALSNTADAGFATGSWVILSGDWDGANLHFWRHGVLKDTVAVTAMAGTGTNNSIGIDIPDATIFPWTGDIAEILIYNSSLSTTDRQNVENYLAVKYAL